MISLLEEITNKKAKIQFEEERKGDVKHSFADIKKAKELLDWTPKVSLKDGLVKTVDYYSSTHSPMLQT